MIEVEIKLPVHRRSTIEHGLVASGFTAGNLIRESDIYFTSPEHDFMHTDEALRIRTSENYSTASSSSFLTYKGPKLDTVSTTRKELETAIEDSEVCRNILRCLGYTELSPVNKLRQYYHKRPSPPAWIRWKALVLFWNWKYWSKLKSSGRKP